MALAFAALCVAALAILQQQSGTPNLETYSTFDAHAGGFRAWYQLLERMNVPVERFEERAGLLDASTRALVVGDPSNVSSAATYVSGTDLGQEDAVALGGWVRDGGALLVAGSGLVAPLAGNHVSLPQSSMIAARGRAFIAPSLAAFGVRRYDAGGIERLVARKTDTVLLRDGRGVVALRYPLGRGSVIDVVDGSLFRNGSIARYDRARLAVALAALLARRPETRIAFDEAIHGYAAPLHWWLVLPRPFVFAVAAGALVLAVALAGAALRLGPARAAEPERAPTSEEYLDALAALMQKAHAGRASLQQASVSTHRLLGRHAAGDHAGETVGALDALAAQTHPTDRDVIRGLELAHAVRKEYAGRERRR